MRSTYSKIRSALLLSIVIICVGHTGYANAARVPACTMINNQAQVYFSTTSSQRFAATSNAVTTVINEFISATLTWLDSSTVSVFAGDTRQYTVFSLTNTGGNAETFFINIDSQVTNDQFDPQAVGLYLDSNANGTYDPATDLSPSREGITLQAGQAAQFIIVVDIPANRSDGTPLEDRDIGLIDVEVTTSHGNGAIGTVTPGSVGCGSALIYRNAFPLRLSASFIVKDIYVEIEKTSAIEDQFGGSEPYPGSTITYTLKVKATGSATAADLSINDRIPANTTYKPGTLTLDGESLTDATDHDTGEATGSPVNQIAVHLGDQQQGVRTITFAVTID